MRTFIPLIFISIFLVATPSQAELLRANHGATHYPIWSELTYFERTTLGDLHLARSNQPDALLALYLVASGIRELDAFESANRRIKAFVEIIEERQFDADDPIVLGEVVNRQMHEHFFLRKSDSKAPSGYATDQSRLMGIVLWAYCCPHMRLFSSIPVKATLMWKLPPQKGLLNPTRGSSIKSKVPIGILTES